MFAEKLVKFFSSPLAAYTYSSQMCPAIYLPAPALKLAHKSVRRQIAPPYIPSILHRELNFTKKVLMYHYFHIPTISHYLILISAMKNHTSSFQSYLDSHTLCSSLEQIFKKISFEI